MVSETARMSVSVPPDKQERLDFIAQSQDRSRNWLDNHAIDQYVDLYDWQAKRIQERLDIASGKITKFHLSDDVDAAIEKFKA